ncbi:coiled-coil domain-containing protein 69 isoform X1 [Hyla sarda]|uniref:coiled-coil domain-containing protein 69 isoform X1 n=1 Tax=Hyla sarda TaxID=327740 RepID=UPI0024C355D0|nr:coiled-coil domain-containing protein 69 isoform X1 [Hyla sarda]
MGCQGSKSCCCLHHGARKKRRHKKKNEQELNDVNDNGTQKIKDNDQEIKNLLQRFHEEKIALEKANSLKLEELERDLKEQAKRDADVETERRLSEMKAKMDGKIAELQKSFEQEKASLTEIITDLRSQLESFLQKLQKSEESALKQNYERHIKDYGSPGEFWEQELHSLYFVIEMKNNLIKEKEKKILNQQVMMERILALEEKVKMLQQENEALQEQTQKHSTIAMCLTEELLSTKAALEKEIQLREQLQHDKEQRVYRAVSGDGSRPFSLSISSQDVAVLVT